MSLNQGQQFLSDAGKIPRLYLDDLIITQDVYNESIDACLYPVSWVGIPLLEIRMQRFLIQRAYHSVGDAPQVRSRTFGITLR